MNTRTRLGHDRRWAATLALIASLVAAPQFGWADDTEVFFDQGSSRTTNPNILFVIPTGSTMGCKVGSTEPCAAALTNGESRMDAVKNALVEVLETLQARNIGVNIGLMRGNNNGRDGANAAKGGMVIQHVAPLTDTSVGGVTHVENMKRWTCKYGTPIGQCNLVYPNSGAPKGVQMLAPSNDATFDRLGSGRQALTEILFEANRYLGARREVWASNGGVGPSYSFPGKGYSPSVIWGPATQDPGSCPGQNCVYKTPVANVCQGNYIVVISDGVLASDTGNDLGANAIGASAGDPQKWFKVYNDSYKVTPTGPTLSLTGLTDSQTGCSRNTGINYAGRQLSDCADDLVYSMRNGGFVNGQPRAQVFTYTVGFDVSAATTADGQPSPDAPRKLLQLIARAGGGKYIEIQEADTLANELLKIVDEVVIANASFTSPAVSINSFNRTQNLNELYMSVFRPSVTSRWKGNVKKYKLAPNGDIQGKDANNNDVLAVNALKGVFLPGVASLWTPSTQPDGVDVLAGGAANRLPSDPAQRKIYTNPNGGTSLDNLESVLSAANPAAVLGYTALGLTPPPCPSPSTTVANQDNPAVCQLVNWIRGADVADVLPKSTVTGVPDGNGNTTEARKDMGDPLHTRPAIVIYGGTTANPDLDDAVVFGVTNDGFLHAFDPDTGDELWSFVPWDRLSRMAYIYRNRTMSVEHPDGKRERLTMGLDGTIRLFKLDKNRDGIVDYDAGDRVYLFFGMRRGGQNYYAVDVSKKNSNGVPIPELMWIAGPTTDATIPANRQLPLIGQTWSRPVVTRARVPGYSNSDNPDNYVVVFGGGYDASSQDVTTPQPYVTDGVGTGIYMLDAISGRLIWRAGPDGAANLQLNSMNASIPADLTVLDLTGDGFLDLIYVGDLRGRVWRLDFNNIATTMSAFAAGGVFADLGGTGSSGARRFFNSPDVSYVSQGAASWLNIAIGSGNREMPISDQQTNDRFYSLRDTNKLVPYNWINWTSIRETDLIDVTPTVTNGVVSQATVPVTAAGWMLRLSTMAGEKSISPSRTFDNTIFFPTFVPQKRTDDTDDNVCTEAIGYNNLYEVSVFDAKPSKYLDATTHSIVANGLAMRLEQFGIAPETVFLFPGSDGQNQDATRPPPICLIGVESCGQFGAFEPKRTFWRQSGAE